MAIQGASVRGSRRVRTAPEAAPSQASGVTSSSNAAFANVRQANAS